MLSPTYVNSLKHLFGSKHGKNDSDDVENRMWFCDSRICTGGGGRLESFQILLCLFPSVFLAFRQFSTPMSRPYHFHLSLPWHATYKVVITLAKKSPSNRRSRGKRHHISLISGCLPPWNVGKLTKQYRISFRCTAVSNFPIIKYSDIFERASITDHCLGFVFYSQIK